MADAQAQPQALWRRFSAWVGNPLDWKSIDRALLIVCITLIVTTPLVGLGTFFRTAPVTLEFLNQDFLPLAVVVVCVWWLMNFGFLAVGLFLRRRWDESRPFAHVVAQSNAVAMAFAAYSLGAASHPIMMVAMVAVLLHFLLLDLLPVALAIATFAALMTLEAAAVLSGRLPYAPLFREAPYGGGWIDPRYFLITAAMASFVSVLAVGLIGYILLRWRGREEHLAHAYRELDLAKDALVRAESLAAVGSLVTGAAHELRNPLGSSGSLLQDLREEVLASSTIAAADKENIDETLAVALRGQQRAARIAERLYSLTDALAPTDEKQSLTTILEALAARYPQVEFVGTRNAAPLHVNDRSLTTVLSNLLDNAIAAGGRQPPTLEIHLTPAPRLRSGLPLSVNEEGAGGRSELQLVVSDSGRGIAADLLPHVFQPFVTGQKAGEGHGVGLGLYIVYELVARMGGTVELESEPGKGTKTTVKLPA